MSSNGQPTTSPLPSPTKNRGWLWYFLILAVLSVLATGILIAYNLAQQLKPEQLAAAKKQWQDQGPASYHLIYTVRIDEADRPDLYDVRVKDHKVEQALVNGLAQPSERFYYYGMEALYRYVQGFVDLGAKKEGPKAYMRASFDEKTGALMTFVRRVMGTRQRVAITVEKFDH